jgi:type IV pilus assembly protein PilB
MAGDVRLVHTPPDVPTGASEEPMGRLRIGELLVQRGRIDGSQLRSALAFQRQWGGRLGRSIVQLGFMQERDVLAHVGEQIGVPFVEGVGDLTVAREVLALLPERLMRARRVLPLERRTLHRRGPLVIATADPGDLAVLDEIAFATGLEVAPVLAADSDLECALARLLDGVVRRAPQAFGAREDAIDLPEDTSPIPGWRWRQ